MASTQPAPPAPPLCSLFVGNLDTRVYRELLTKIFSLAGKVTQCHIVYDKATGVSSGFGFVHYEDHRTAQAAMEKFRGRSIYRKLMTIDWARASAREPGARPPDDPAAALHCLFVGNLSPDVSDEQLVTAFSEFGSCASAKCARDPATYKTQGFAFVSFRDRADAAAALDAMNGQMLNNRALRVDWAKGRTGASGPPAGAAHASSGGAARGAEGATAGETKKDVLSLEAIAAQTSPANVTAYVSGLDPRTTEEQIRGVFATHGPIREVRIPDSAKTATAETIYAFVRYVEHAAAARAVCESQGGVAVGGRVAQVHWGREAVRRQPVIARPAVGHGPPPAHGFYHHGGFAPPPPGAQAQQPPLHSQAFAPAHHQYPPPQYQPRAVYPSQPYARAPPPGPTHHPHATTQHRYRPY